MWQPPRNQLLSVPGKVLSRVLLERMKDAVDPLLRDQQAELRKTRCISDHIATLHIIVEQSLEWNSSLYINFVDYQKAFDSVYTETFWKLLRHYGILLKLVNLIRNSYTEMSCRLIYEGQFTRPFRVTPVFGKDVFCPLSFFCCSSGLDHEEVNRTKKKWNTVNLFHTAGWSELCRWCGTSLLQPSMDARKDFSACQRFSSSGL